MKAVALVALTGFLMIFESSLAIGKEKIQWMILDWPPAFIMEGDLKGRGFQDIGLSSLIKELDEFEHEVVAGPLARIKRLASNGRRLCYYGPIYSQNYANQNRFVLSAPISIVYPHQFVILKKNRTLFGDGEAVSFETLLSREKSDGNLKLGVVNSWKYGKELDDIVEQFGDTNYNLFKRSGVEADFGLIKMLSADRLHYIPMYSFQFRWLLSDSEYSPDQFLMLPIEELKDKRMMGAIGCTYNAWGVDKIDRINQALIKIRKTPEFYNALERWIAPRGQERTYQKEYEKEVLSRTGGFVPEGAMSPSK